MGGWKGGWTTGPQSAQIPSSFKVSLNWCTPLSSSHEANTTFVMIINIFDNMIIDLSRSHTIGAHPLGCSHEANITRSLSTTFSKWGTELFMFDEFRCIQKASVKHWIKTLKIRGHINYQKTKLQNWGSHQHTKTQWKDLNFFRWKEHLVWKGILLHYIDFRQRRPFRLWWHCNLRPLCRAWCHDRNFYLSLFL